MISNSLYVAGSVPYRLFKSSVTY